jgi:hypothetical protein
MISPLKDSVNNFKSLEVLKKIIPERSIIGSFLFFCGELELRLAAENRFIIAHTDKYVIYEFWQSAIQEPTRLAEIVKLLHPIDEEKVFYIFQEEWPKYKDPGIRSALFFLLNRCSQGGSISAGAFDNKNFNPIALSRLSTFKPPENFHLRYTGETLLENQIEKVQGVDYLLIPAGKFSYNLMEHGMHKGLEMYTIYHRQLCQALKNTSHKWIVLYKNHRELHRIFKDYDIKMIDSYGKITDKAAACEELIIANF